MIDTKQLIKAGEEKMTFAIEYLDEQLSHIRAGKANPKILDCVKVMYYGAPVPLTNVATVTVPDARTIMSTLRGRRRSSAILRKVFWILS